MVELKIIENQETNEYFVEPHSTFLGARYDNLSDEIKVIFPQREIDNQSTCTMIITNSGEEVDCVNVRHDEVFELKSPMSHYQRVFVGFSFQKPDGYVKNTNIGLFYFRDAQNPDAVVPTTPIQREKINLLLADGFASCDWSEDDATMLEFKNVDGEVVKRISIASGNEEQIKQIIADETADLQPKTDESLVTEDKTIPGAINEICNVTVEALGYLYEFILDSREVVLIDNSMTLEEYDVLSRRAAGGSIVLVMTIGNISFQIQNVYASDGKYVWESGLLPERFFENKLAKYRITWVEKLGLAGEVIYLFDENTLPKPTVNDTNKVLKVVNEYNDNGDVIGVKYELSRLSIPKPLRRHTIEFENNGVVLCLICTRSDAFSSYDELYDYMLENRSKIIKILFKSNSVIEYVCWCGNEDLEFFYFDCIQREYAVTRIYKTDASIKQATVTDL